MTLPRIVLASTSPFRAELLGRLQVPFEQAAPEVDETRLPDEAPREMVMRLAEAKARAIATGLEHGLVIGSDQCAVIGGEILGKPGSFERAFEQLRASSGRSVTFETGLCVVDAESGRAEVDCVSFEVGFRELDDARIRNYLEREQPWNCAGSFKSEGLGITLFRYLRGDDPTALIGLPLIRLVDMLEAFGLRLPLPTDA
ncbi:MAG: septum formation inhibitor Maf [Gammaproteobacteria bacterium]|nr:MAG: septum formation inhibitor Maf [Gammaproteobacteria bacterium]